MQGISQAQNLVDHLAGPAAPTFTSLYSSTMTRAVETASPLARKLGLSLHTDADLVEYDHGLPFYIPTEDIQEEFEVYWANLQQGLYAGHHIDLKAFQHRVVSAVDREIGRASCRERVGMAGGAGRLQANVTQEERTRPDADGGDTGRRAMSK